MRRKASLHVRDVGWKKSWLPNAPELELLSLGGLQMHAAGFGFVIPDKVPAASRYRCQCRWTGAARNLCHQWQLTRARAA